MRILSILLFLSIGFLARSQDQVTADVSRAIGNGNAGQVGQYFTPNVDVAILGREEMYSSSEATAQLQRFFSSHQVISFEVKHKGTSKLDDQYRIGDLKTAKGEFRVTFFMKKTPQGMRIKQIRIESADDGF
ncbi:MAG: DUF4783 domain-containing protein [Flavobacteriales bacterium]|nr:DUF4783 domain-containing protein [Flavobacteriales bacterium]